jgi:hypothetical protein
LAGKESPLAKPFDHEFETAEARRFNILAAAFEKADRRGLSERFSMLAVLCEEKARIFKELVREVVFDDPKPEGKVLKWPARQDSRMKKTVADN